MQWKSGLRAGQNNPWDDMLNKGTAIMKYANNKDSAHEIIRRIIRMSEKSRLENNLQKLGASSLNTARPAPLGHNLSGKIGLRNMLGLG